MKCAIVHPDFGIGGAERLILDQALALKELKHSVDIFTTRYDPDRSFEESRRFTIYSIGQFLPRTIFGYGYVFLCWIRMLLVCLYMIVNDKDYDVVLVDQVSVIMPILKLRYKKVIFYCHFPDKLLASHSTQLRRLYRHLFDVLEEKTLPYADCLWANSKFTKSVMNDVFPEFMGNVQYAERVKVLYPCVSLPTGDITDAGDNKKPTKCHFVSINRFERKKKVELALEAAGKLKKASSADFHLTIAGGYDTHVSENVEYHEELKSLAKELDIDDVTFMLSFTDLQKDELLRSASCILYTPANEHFGIVPLDAMSYGKPVIAVNSGGPCETIVDGVTGFLVRQDAGEFARCMQKILEDDDLARKMGEAGRKRVEQNFSFEIFTKQIQAELKTL